MNYTEATNYIEEVPKFTKKNKPENTLELLRRIGHPERSMKVIHVAGTNGKGSVCAFLSSILTEAGKCTGLFTSPHLVEITERFQINGRPVSQDGFTRAFEQIKTEVDDMVQNGFAHPAYFELLFAAGLLIFRDAGVEYLVLETGLGGRLDATNLVEHPIACVLTSISLDHMEYLGNTVAEIAGEKAGIIKEGVPVIYDGRNPEAEAVILSQAEKMHAPAYRFDGSMCEITGKTDKSIDFIFNSRYDRQNTKAVPCGVHAVSELYGALPVTVPYLAEYQIVNSSLAMAALRVVDPEREISDAQVVKGIADTRWQGRMETVLPGVVLDGAHNADGIREFIRTVQDIQAHRPVSLLFSAVVEKEHEKMIRTICESISPVSIVVTQVGGSRVVEAEALAEEFRKYTKAEVIARDDVAEAFETALALRGDSMLFCAGSLYLVGELKAILAKRGKNGI
ncbi:MAG: bifunctional folylpolyglutamate synthase/dihydrofolate synthase [Lachnospiraceae bacterium]|nr:bifunctional folylpolyglutamate synthase/dihydrofolate synthase [Lachnospiraceae bacterium]RKJ52068.1 bifunctional folylpolyglutamate synthase/dihydrofolate synthase [bacterium 1XD42-54]